MWIWQITTCSRLCLQLRTAFLLRDMVRNRNVLIALLKTLTAMRQIHQVKEHSLRIWIWPWPRHKSPNSTKPWRRAWAWERHLKVETVKSANSTQPKISTQTWAKTASSVPRVLQYSTKQLGAKALRRYHQSPCMQKCLRPDKKAWCQGCALKMKNPWIRIHSWSHILCWSAKRMRASARNWIYHAILPLSTHTLCIARKADMLMWQKQLTSAIRTTFRSAQKKTRCLGSNNAPKSCHFSKRNWMNIMKLQLHRSFMSACEWWQIIPDRLKEIRTKSRLTILIGSCISLKWRRKSQIRRPKGGPSH